MELFQIGKKQMSDEVMNSSDADFFYMLQQSGCDACFPLWGPFIWTHPFVRCKRSHRERDRESDVLVTQEKKERGMLAGVDPKGMIWAR